MHKRFVYLLFSALFLSSFSTLRFDFVVSAATVTVPIDFPTIQAAINNATLGDTILVREGIYRENVVVNKSVSILGETRNTTIIDGGGSSVVVRITADNVSVSGFTIQNSGGEAYQGGILIESSFNNISENIITVNGLTGIYLDGSFGSRVSENIIIDNRGEGAVFVHSFNNFFLNNLVTRNNGGIRLYSSDENNISRNIVTNDQLGGIHLFYSSYNSLFDNVVHYNTEYGLSVDFSSNSNRIFDNSLVGNFKYGLVLGSVSDNILRRNNMTGNQFNFYVLLARRNLKDYLNDVDPSNLVDGKEIHYIINGRDLVINSTSYPNIGYLALVNSTHVTVNELNFTNNGQAMLIAFTLNTTLEKLDASNNNHGIQLCSSNHTIIRNCTLINNSADGITVDRSSTDNAIINNVITSNNIGIRMVHSCKNNTISANSITDNDKGVWINSFSSDNMVAKNVITSNNISISLTRKSPSKIIGNTIINNSQGLFLQNTNGSLIHHNNFVDNAVQVETSNTSSIWDMGYSSGGDFWDDYDGEDSNGDGMGDTPYVIDEYNVDRYPLVSFWSEEEKEPPVIGFPTCFPDSDVQPYENVTVYVAAADVGSGLKNVTLSYSNNETSWNELKMTYNSTAELFIAVLPGQPPGTLVKYNIVAFDNAKNVAVRDNFGQFFTYEVIPEFGSAFFILSFSITTVIALFIVKTFRRKNPNLCC